MMENISLLLSEALTPYQVHLAPDACQGKCLLTLRDGAGNAVLQRTFNLSQFTGLRSLTDIADGLHRDLRVAEGRLEPCMIAALRNAGQSASFASAR